MVLHVCDSLIIPYSVMVWLLLDHYHEFWIEERWHLLFAIIALFMFVGNTDGFEVFLFSVQCWIPLLLSVAEATGGTVGDDGVDAVRRLAAGSHGHTDSITSAASLHSSKSWCQPHPLLLLA